MLITNRRLNYLIDGKDKFTFHASHHVTTIMFLIIGIIATSILFAFFISIKPKSYCNGTTTTTTAHFRRNIF